MMSDPAQPYGGSQDVETSQKPAAWNTNKFREEYDIAKSRLTDQKFDICRCKHNAVGWEDCFHILGSKKYCNGDSFADPPFSTICRPSHASPSGYHTNSSKS